jgi:hypothetical protein
MATLESTPPRKPHNSQWVIVTFNKPVGWNRSDSETWTFNPGVRYVLNANQLEKLGPYIESISDLQGTRYHNPLRVTSPLANSTILVERYRDRGIGDLLFLTGPLNYIKFISGGSAKIHLYGLADRASVLDNHPAIEFGTPLYGPVIYDTLQSYSFQWFIDSVTEYNEERDQLNVYDALYKQLGIDPATVDHRFKKPSMQLSQDDVRDLDQLYYFIYLNKKLDLRRTPYYVVAPLTNGNIRMADYGFWLRTIREMAKARPVIVTGYVSERMPATDMPFGSFSRAIDEMGSQAPVINLMGATPLRVVSALIANAVCLATLDTGPLYIAQSFRVPAVSLWGPIDPAKRIGYDREYMELAVWEKAACTHSPCFAYARFPVSKCPMESRTVVCEVLRSAQPEMVLEKIAYVENKLAASRQLVGSTSASASA